MIEPADFASNGAASANDTVPFSCWLSDIAAGFNDCFCPFDRRIQELGHEVRRNSANDA